jgi:signal peptidase I
MPPSPIVGQLASALLLALLAATWALFGPTRFGGPAAYVIVSGISMEPTFHRGDLVILRQADDYQVGEVVTYRHPTIGPVIHRIIGRDGDRFIFKGDNNSWIDAYRPSRADLIGGLWIYIPRAGLAVEQLRTPRNLAALVAVLGVMIMTTGASEIKRAGRGGAAPLTLRLTIGARARRPRSASGVAAGVGDLLFVVAALGFAALLLGALAFASPATRTLPEQLDYEQSGVWSYSAAAPAGLYDQDIARTGDPIFRQVASSVLVQFDYRFAAAQPADVRGTARLLAEVSDVSGWKRTIELRPATEFAGAALKLDGTLDLRQVQALIGGFEHQTGIQRPQYALAVVPDLHVRGQLAGQPLDETFAPRLEFELDGQSLRLQQGAAGAAGGLNPTKPGAVRRERTEPNTLGLFGLRLAVAAARRMALVGLLLAIGIGGLLMLRARQFAPAGEEQRIQRRYGALLVAIRGTDTELRGPLVEVATIDDLAKLALGGGHMILCHAGQAEPRYLVQAGEVTYRYKPRAADHLEGIVP